MENSHPGLGLQGNGINNSSTSLLEDDRSSLQLQQNLQECERVKLR